MRVEVAPEERTFDEVKRLCCAGLDEATLLRETAERLRRMVPFEGYCAHTVDPLSGLLTNAVPEGMGGEKEARFFLEHLYFAEDVNEYNSMARSRRPVALLSETTRGRLERSLRYRELLAPLGFADELRCILTADRELWGAIGVARETGHPGFEPREGNFLRRVAPHLGAGLKAAVLRSQSPPKGTTAFLGCWSSIPRGGSRTTPRPRNGGSGNSRTPIPAGTKAVDPRRGGKDGGSRRRCGRW